MTLDPRIRDAIAQSPDPISELVERFLVSRATVWSLIRGQHRRATGKWKRKAKRKLSAHARSMIRKATTSASELAAAYGVNRSTIYRIRAAT